MKYEILSFEQELSRIDEISSKLAKGNLPLQESIDLYEEAVERLQHGKKLLNDAELKVLRISSKNEEEEISFELSGND